MECAGISTRRYSSGICYFTEQYVYLFWDRLLWAKRDPNHGHAYSQASHGGMSNTQEHQVLAGPKLSLAS